MKNFKKVISVVLLLCMILSLMPLQASAEGEVTYVLDTDGIDVGATYLVVRVSSNWMGTNIMALDGAGSAGYSYTKLKENQLSSGTIAYVDGFEDLEWTVESSGDAANKHYLVHNEGGTNRYLDITTNTISYSATPAPLLITPKENSNEYFVVHQKADGQYNYLFLNTNGNCASNSVGTISGINATYSIRFYKKTGGTPAVPTYTLNFNDNGIANAAPAAMTDLEEGKEYQVPAPQFLQYEAEDAIYTFANWCETAEGTGKTYAPGDPIALSADMTLYAIWQKQEKHTASVATVLDGEYTDLSEILGDGVTLYIGKGDQLWTLNRSNTGVYTASVAENGDYDVYLMQADGTFEKMDVRVSINDAGGAAQLNYYSVTYMSNGGVFYKDIYPENSRATVITDTPVAGENDRFLGWVDENGKFLASGELIATYLQTKVVLTAKWQKVGNMSYTVRYREKNTEKELHPDMVVDNVAEGAVIFAGHVAQKITGYTYVGAGIGGQFYEKSRDPYITISTEGSENIITVYYSPDPDLHMDKDVLLENDGTYTVEMHLFTHNNPVTTLIDQNIPLDIVLVLDQSSSIQSGKVYDDLQQSVTTFIDLVAKHATTNGTDHRIAIVGYGSIDEYGATGTGHIAGAYDDDNLVTIKKDGYWTNTGLFDAHGDFHVYPITGFNYEKYDGVPVSNDTYYTKDAHTGEYLVLDYHEVYRHMITEEEAKLASLEGTKIYGYIDGDFVEIQKNDSGLWLNKDSGELYSSTKFFTRHEKVWTHRSGIDAREIHAYVIDGVYTPIDGHDEIYIRTETTEENPDKSIYRDALIPVTMGAQGSGFVDPVLDKAVGDLGAKGKTYISYGMRMANRIFEENPLSELNESQERQRVIVVFTDGKPGDSANFDEDESNAALKEAAIASGEHGALIYTIGLYGEEIVDAESDQDYFMNGLSSNYPDATKLDDVWLETILVQAPAGISLNIGGPYYTKIGENVYPLSYSVDRNKTDKKYYINWKYKVAEDEYVIFYTVENTVNAKHPVITAYEEDGVIKNGVNGIQIFRKSGTGYEPAASSKYYSYTNDAKELEYYFASIVQELTTRTSEEINMKDDAILRDIMGQGLVLTPGTVITVSKQAGTFLPDEKRVEWADELEELDTLVIPEDPAGTLYSKKGITVDGVFIPYIGVYNLDAENPTDPTKSNYHPHTVDISGYEYDNWYMNADKLEGYRLVATITRVEARDNVIWGRETYTNHEQSGLWQRKDEEGNRTLLEAFDRPATAFVERAYVLDYGKEFKLTDWYFDDADGKESSAIHLDMELDNGMNYFENAAVANGTDRGNTKYGNVRVENGEVYYQPITTQWNGYDQFYVFGNSADPLITALDANRTGNLWNKVTVIPANSVYYEDSFGMEEANGVNDFSGFTFTGDWEVRYTDDDESNGGNNQEQPEHVEDDTYGETHGWTDDLADDWGFSDGSAMLAGVDKTKGAKLTFRFTGTGVDVYTRTNADSGIVVAVLTPISVEGEARTKSIAMDNLAMSGDYYQIPTVSFMDLPYGTYEVLIIATAANRPDAAERDEDDKLRYEYYVDGIRVYNPLGDVNHDGDHTIAEAYGKEQNAVFTEIRDIILKYDDFNIGMTDDDQGKMGAVFIDWIREGQESGNDQAGTGVPTYEVGTTFSSYGPKNEIYLSQGQAIVLKVDPQNHYYVGMKSLRSGETATVKVTGVGDNDGVAEISIGHTTDMYYEVTPLNGYIVIQNVSTNGALLALTKLRTTNVYNAVVNGGVEYVTAEQAVKAVYDMNEAPVYQPTPEPEMPEQSQQTPEEVWMENNKKLAQSLFTDVRTWLQAR